MSWFALPWFDDPWFEREWFPDFSALSVAFFGDDSGGGGPERASEDVPRTPKPRKWHDRELEHELELWFEERKKYGRIYLLEPEPERIVLPEPEVRPVFIPYEPPPVRDDTADRLAMAAQRAKEAVDRLVAQSNEAAARTVAAAIAKIEEAETMKVVAAAMAVMEEN